MSEQWVELDFQKSVAGHISGLGGRTDPIENRKHPGNSDLLFSSDAAMGVIELKQTKEFREHWRLRLKHPVSPEQRRFLLGHGRLSNYAFLGVLFVHNDHKRNEAIFWRWHEIDRALSSVLQVSRGFSAWNGAWPIKDMAKRKEFAKMLGFINAR